MKIAIDLRSLSSGSISGVENYTLNLLEHLLAQDKQNTYTLFYNSWRNGKMPDLHFINSKIIKTTIPNRILNALFKMNAIKLESLIGEFDCLYMPNLNQFSIETKTKLAITVHDLSPIVTPEFYNIKRRLWHKFLNYKNSYQKADVIFAVSQYTKNDLIRIFNIPEEKIKLVYPGLDHKVFNPKIDEAVLRLARNVYGLPGDYILFLNTIEPRKNLGNLISAFEQLKDNTNLVIVGRKGWKYGGIFKQIQASKKNAKIKYLGYIEEQDKPAIIKLAKALVYPSFYEGFGFQPLEAMAMGVPCLVSSVTSLPEVTHGAALMVDPYNIADMAHALEEIIENESLREQLIAKGLERSKDFSWQVTAGQVLSGLNNLEVTH